MWWNGLALTTFYILYALSNHTPMTLGKSWMEESRVPESSGLRLSG